jgi:hypothetical protein
VGTGIPASQPITSPTGRLLASIALIDPPSEHFGDQFVPMGYHLHRLRGALVASQGGELFKLEGNTLVDMDAVEGLGTQPLPGIGETVPLWMEIDELVGSWPSELWASVSGMWVSDGARIHSLFHDTYRGSDKGFTRVPQSAPSYGLGKVAAWSGGRVLGIDHGAFRVLSGPKSMVPKPASGANGDCPVRVNVEAITALPSGELFGLGRGPCDEGAYLVERWGDDDAASKAIQRLPPYFGTPFPKVDHPFMGESAWLVAEARDAVYAIRTSGNEGPSQSRLARFDGSDWSELALPIDRLVTSADAGPDGSLWIIADGKPFTFDARRGWREVTLPTPPPLPAECNAGAPKPRFELNSVRALGGDRAYFGAHVYYADSTWETGAILATAAPALKVVALRGVRSSDAGAPNLPSDAGTLAAATGPGPTSFTQACTTPFVILFTVSKAAPPDFAFPATRDALLAAKQRPNVKFVEFTYRGGRTLGAIAPDADQARALVELITARVKGSKPTLVCYAPSDVIRVVQF